MKEDPLEYQKIVINTVCPHYAELITLLDDTASKLLIGSASQQMLAGARRAILDLAMTIYEERKHQ